MVEFAQISAAGKSEGRTSRRTWNAHGLNFVQRHGFVFRQVAVITFQKMLWGIDKAWVASQTDFNYFLSY